VMTSPKYLRTLDKELERRGYSLQRTKKHRVYYNAELGKSLTTSKSPSDRKTHYRIQQVIKQNEKQFLEEDF